MSDSMSSLTGGGYPLEIVDGGIDKKYLCGHCHLVLREPMQSFCGHRFCKNCSRTLLQNGQVSCPACVEEGASLSDFTIIKQDQIFPDNAMKREFLAWKVKCPNLSCSWAGSFKQYEVHSEDCAHRTVTCDECGRSVTVPQLAQHRATECPARAEACPYCHEHIPVLQAKVHSKTCAKMPVQCDVCGKEMLREKLAGHYEPSSGECTARRICCPYQCGEYVDPEVLEEHENQSLVEHVRAINQRVALMEGRPPTSASGQTRQLSQPVQVSNEMQDLRSKMVALEKKVTTALGDTSAQAMGYTSNAASSPSSASSASASASTSGPVTLEELEKKVRMLEDKVQVFLDAVGVLGDSVERNTGKMNSMERSVQEEHKGSEKRVKDVEKGLAIKDLLTAELETRIKTLEVSSYDGVLLWKINDFSRKRQDACQGRTTSIYSPPFYTSRTGYKMCARMYLNGDGMGKGSYISLFFVIMRNEYDALMRWPFRQKVSLILIDQNNLQHIVDAFRPDPSSSSFRKPQSEMNIASGCPLFCPLSSLTSEQQAYVKDDTMYVKIIVDCSDLNTTS